MIFPVRELIEHGTVRRTQAVAAKVGMIGGFNHSALARIGVAIPITRILVDHARNVVWLNIHLFPLNIYKRSRTRHREELAETSKRFDTKSVEIVPMSRKLMSLFRPILTATVPRRCAPHSAPWPVAPTVHDDNRQTLVATG